MESVQGDELLAHVAAHQERLAIVSLHDAPQIGEPGAESLDVALAGSDEEQVHVSDHADANLEKETVQDDSSRDGQPQYRALPSEGCPIG